MKKETIKKKVRYIIGTLDLFGWKVTKLHLDNNQIKADIEDEVIGSIQAVLYQPENKEDPPAYAVYDRLNIILAIMEG